jgi:hypothetical protein
LRPCGLSACHNKYLLGDGLRMEKPNIIIAMSEFIDLHQHSGIFWSNIPEFFGHSAAA